MAENIIKNNNWKYWNSRSTGNSMPLPDNWAELYCIATLSNYPKVTFQIPHTIITDGHGSGNINNGYYSNSAWCASVTISITDDTCTFEEYYFANSYKGDALLYVYYT